MPSYRYFSNDAPPTTLASSLGSTGNPSVASITGLPSSYPFTMLIDWGIGSQEAISVTGAPTGTGPYTLPCTRGIDGTTAQSHLSGASVVHGFTAQDFAQPIAVTGGLYNPRAPQYGATGNGTTDDTAALQAAATACTAAGGGTYYLPAGTYKTSSAITFTNMGGGVKVIGDGLATIIQVTGSYDALTFTTGTGLIISDLFVESTVSVPTAGAGIGINSVADYRILNVSTSSANPPYFGLHTTGGTSMTSNSLNCYFQGYYAGFYGEGSFTLTDGHYGGGYYGAVLNSASGHSQRMVRVGLYGPLPLTTWNTGLGANPNKTVWLTDVECNYQTGLGAPPEGTGGMNLANCGGDIHMATNWLAGSGALIGGGPAVASGGRTDTGCTTTAASTTVMDASCISGDAGATVIGFGIPPGTTVSSVTAGVQFVMSNPAQFTSTAATLNIGGTAGVVTPTWVDIVGGVYSGNSLTMQNGINLAAGTEITVTGAHLTGSADHTLYDDITIGAAVTGPVAITGCEFSGSSRYNTTSAVTSGPVSIVGNAFSGFSGGQPVNVTGTLSQHTIINGGYPSTIPSSLTAGVSALTDASTIAVNAAMGNHFRVTLGGNRTLGTPTNPVDGQKITFEFTQDGTGGRTLAFSGGYAFSLSVPQPTLTGTAGATDVIGFMYSSEITAWRCMGVNQGFSA